MRLLNTTTLELHEFFDIQVPPYAILSHKWEDDEILFKDVKKRRNLEAKGWRKVQRCCAMAREDGHQWLWMDTCCIDKRSSAELSEAINSMFQWYENAERCYAYLGDVSCEESDLCTKEQIESWNAGGTSDQFWLGKGEDITSPNFPLQTSGLREELASAFRASQWFTRSWTLQELLAPVRLRFIDKDWKGVLGNKRSLNKIISQITGIPNVGFRTAKNMRFVSVGARMCWASRRVCTRAEDIAYSLLGIFNVNMPLLYGEGEYKAFLRLQLEILKDSDDESIFAWYPETSFPSNLKEIRGGLLAGSPSDFASRILSKVQPLGIESRALREPYTMTHKGLAIKTYVHPEEKSNADLPNKRYFKMALNCYISKDKHPLAIRLVRVGPHSFERVLRPGKDLVLEWDLASPIGARHEADLFEEELIYVPQSPYPELRSHSHRLKDGRAYARDITFDLDSFENENAR